MIEKMEKAIRSEIIMDKDNYEYEASQPETWKFLLPVSLPLFGWSTRLEKACNFGFVAKLIACTRWMCRLYLPTLTALICINCPRNSNLSCQGRWPGRRRWLTLDLACLERFFWNGQLKLSQASHCYSKQRDGMSLSSLSTNTYICGDMTHWRHAGKIGRGTLKDRSFGRLPNQIREASRSWMRIVKCKSQREREGEIWPRLTKLDSLRLGGRYIDRPTDRQTWQAQD